jgi:hypothetical protein
VEWVEKPYLLAISVNFDAKRCTAATLRLRAANITKLAEPGHRREDKKKVYPGVNGGQLGNRITNVASAIGAGVGADRVAQAAFLTLGCTGTVTTSNVPKEGVVPDPDKDNVSDYSVVIDLDRHAVFGFWFETPTTGMTAAQTALPITEANAIGIYYFVARRKQSAIGESIYGSVDRITGAVSAMENKLYPSGNMQTTEWDLHCKPTRPLF